MSRGRFKIYTARGINQIEKRNETQATYQQSNHLSAMGIKSDTTS